MFKGKLRYIPEAIGSLALITLAAFVYRTATETEGAAKIAQIPFVGTLVISGPKAVFDRAFGVARAS